MFNYKFYKNKRVLIFNNHHIIIIFYKIHNGNFSKSSFKCKLKNVLSPKKRKAKLSLYLLQTVKKYTSKKVCFIRSHFHFL